MMHLLCSIPHPLDATSLYRGAGPLQTLGRGPDVRVTITDGLSWATLKSADAVFFQRPALDDRVQAMKLVKNNGKPIWVDYDDNLHAVPLCNRRYPTYGHPHIQHNVATMIAMANVVTVTTQALAYFYMGVLKQFPKSDEYVLNPDKVHVIPNAYDFEIMPSLVTEKKPRAKLVVWRGSDSHCKDLMTYTEEIAGVISDNQDWKYEFIGEPFWWTIEAIQKVANPQTVSVTAAMDPVQYFDYLNKQAPSLVIVPLEDITFNRAKSNIAWIEATAAGSVVLAPEWPEWKKPGVITYSSVRDFGDKMRRFLRGEFDSAGLWKMSRDHIAENLRLDSTNNMRKELLYKMVDDFRNAAG